MKEDILSILPPNTTTSNSLIHPMGTDAIVTGLTQPLMLEIFNVGRINDEDPWGDIQKVDYWLQSPTNRTDVPGKDLVRGITRNLLATTPAAPEQQQVILSGVQSLQFSFFDGTNWNDTWSTTLTNIPIAIKTAISFAAKTGSPAGAPVQFTVPIVVWGGTNQTGTNFINN
jgi:aldehyde:ferredoxin oxidoreductase